MRRQSDALTDSTFCRDLRAAVDDSFSKSGGGKTMVDKLVSPIDYKHQVNQNGALLLWAIVSCADALRFGQGGDGWTNFQKVRSILLASTAEGRRQRREIVKRCNEQQFLGDGDIPRLKKMLLQARESLTLHDPDIDPTRSLYAGITYRPGAPDSVPARLAGRASSVLRGLRPPITKGIPRPYHYLIPALLMYANMQDPMNFSGPSFPPVNPRFWYNVLLDYTMVFPHYADRELTEATYRERKACYYDANVSDNWEVRVNNRGLTLLEEDDGIAELCEPFAANSIHGDQCEQVFRDTDRYKCRRKTNNINKDACTKISEECARYTRNKARGAKKAMEDSKKALEMAEETVKDIGLLIGRDGSYEAVPADSDGNGCIVRKVQGSYSSRLRNAVHGMLTGDGLGTSVATAAAVFFVVLFLYGLYSGATIIGVASSGAASGAASGAVKSISTVAKVASDVINTVPSSKDEVSKGLNSVFGHKEKWDLTDAAKFAKQLSAAISGNEKAHKAGVGAGGWVSNAKALVYALVPGAAVTTIVTAIAGAGMFTRGTDMFTRGMSALGMHSDVQGVTLSEIPVLKESVQKVPPMVAGSRLPRDT